MKLNEKMKLNFKLYYIAKMNPIIITIDQLPASDQDYSCPFDTSESTNDDKTIKCGFCSNEIKDTCHLFSNSGLDYFYLCQKCYHQNVRLCQSTLIFYFPDELVQLDQNVAVHFEQDELINNYNLIDKKDLILEMYGINPNGLDYQLIHFNQSSGDVDIVV